MRDALLLLKSWTAWMILVAFVLPGGFVVMAYYRASVVTWHEATVRLSGSSQIARVAALTALALAAGFIVAGIGAQIERLIEKIIGAKSSHDDRNKYLRSTFGDEPPGVSSIRLLALRLLFERNFGAALLVGAPAIVWLSTAAGLPHRWVGVALVVTIAVAAYLLYEAQLSNRHIDELCRIVTSATVESPKSDSSGKTPGQ